MSQERDHPDRHSRFFGALVYIERKALTDKEWPWCQKVRVKQRKALPTLYQGSIPTALYIVRNQAIIGAQTALSGSGTWSPAQSSTAGPPHEWMLKNSNIFS
ncbi:hypothetical protein LZ554_000156 [Drepanopeziza brunnea f. sp. 'monogermtubi']|nr:hypothetical protein LZ554_000156 [Drepanopeziza brunnea f. sp. 'monogermtubi']